MENFKSFLCCELVGKFVLITVHGLYNKCLKKCAVFFFMDYFINSYRGNPRDLVATLLDCKIVVSSNSGRAGQSRLGLENTPTKSLQRGKTPPKSILDMTLNKLIRRLM